MKLHGYPDAKPLPFLPIFVREHVFYLLAASAVWAGLTIYAANKPTYFYREMMVAGVVLAGIIAFLGVVAVSLAVIGPTQTLIEPIE